MVTREDRARRLAEARQWRVDNEPYFDAIYGPEARGSYCPRCGEPKRVVSGEDAR